ncbi:MAG: heterodisulfide reductase-related iron-sulfur binding cluster, partial [Candidatus Hydrogenedentes bacterium]|nr:heterodisulfide reductase-related iron-sulfur binding cluster [Candidatus Hydrogenedentota bacterium]
LGEGKGRAPRESHIIILDNGRTAMRDNPEMREALSCIRCGACMNVCPTYGVVGGHTFGYIYPGPIGIPWTAEVHGLEKAGDFAPLCISCGLCKEICPAKIDMPMMIAEVKHRDAKDHPHPRVDEVMMGAESAAKMASAFAPIANVALKSSVARSLMHSAAGIDSHRALPAFKRDTFMKQFARRAAPGDADAHHQVAFFVDVYANYNAPELGMAAVRALEAAGCLVVAPEQQSSGYPYIAYGDLDRARDVARYNVERFARYAEKGFDIVATEPTAAYALSASYPKLLRKSPDSVLVARQTHELFEYLLRVEAPIPVARRDRFVGKRYGFHVSCHQRPLGAGRGAMEWLRRCGADVQLIETGTCCGMGGTFGMKSGALGYELSMEVGKPLFALFKDAGVDAIVTESSVCAIQLAEGVGIPVVHPLMLLAD